RMDRDRLQDVLTDECRFVQNYLLHILQCIQKNWLCQDLSEHVTMLKELEAEPHLRWMIAKYNDTVRRLFPPALEDSIHLLRQVCEQHAAEAQVLVDRACKLFRCNPLLSRNASR
ncbi:unnamed protein product, partial [Effrenium voratum]